jgi:hypothetical protein
MQSQGAPVSSSTPAASTSTTCALSIFAPTRASCSKRARNFSSPSMRALMSLSARSRPVESWVATYTAPMPPTRSGRSIRKSRAKTFPGATDAMPDAATRRRA